MKDKGMDVEASASGTSITDVSDEAGTFQCKFKDLIALSDTNYQT